MEPPAKRARHSHDAESSDEPVPYAPSPHCHSQESTEISGHGVIHKGTGSFNIGRDLYITHTDERNDRERNKRNAEEEQKKREENERKKQEEHRRILLNSLRFAQIDARQLSIKRAHAKTCRWFLQDQAYREWLMSDLSHDTGSFLWIKGKPGAGKSTMMKFLLDQAQQKKTVRKVISFFFNARGGDMEKTTLGLYQSLIVQLLESYQDLQHVLDRYRNGHQWNVESLKGLFQETVEGLSKAPVICFIDALDECEEQEVRDMISYLSGLCDAGNRLYICFASRHYPHITIRKGRSIVLEKKEEHRQDIASYIDSALCIGNGSYLEGIRSDLQEKASGVFMWVVLVIDILNKEYDAGRRRGLRQRLRELPDDLHTLFRDILTRDTNNTPGLLLCIQWVLFARQPLTPKQLYFAILSGLEPETLAECHADETTDEDIAKFLLDSSKGLAESTKSKLPTMQFIHESVRDFLLKDNGLQAIWPDAGTSLEGRGHQVLKQACLAYMASEPVTSLSVPLPMPKASSAEAAAIRDDVGSRLPFLGYANEGILFHADKAEKHGVSQAEFLVNFHFTEWVVHHNLFQQHETRRYTLEVSLCYVLAEGNLGSLIRVLPRTRSCFEVEKERYGAPIFAALATKSAEAVQALIESHPRRYIATQSSKDISAHISECENWSSTFSRAFSFSNQKGVVSHLVEAGHEKILEIFCATEQFDFQSTDRRGWLPLSYATERGHADVARLLIDRGADVNAADSSRQTPLFAALKGGHTDVARLLIDRGADMNVAAIHGQTPLTWASSGGHVDVARLLIDRGADVNAADSSKQTPLFAASRGGHVDVARLLIDRGADMDAADFYGQTPLLAALKGGHVDVARLLVDRGADVNAAGPSGQTPLACASYYGHINMARLFIDRGADMTTTDFYGQTPPTWASYSGHADVVRLLLDRGADMNATNSSGWTPLT